MPYMPPPPWLQDMYGVSSEHMENMEMFSCSPTLVRSDSQRTQATIAVNGFSMVLTKLDHHH